MKRNRYLVGSLTLALFLGAIATASAGVGGDGRTCPGTTPIPNSGRVLTRIFNDCPTSTLGTINNFPAQIQIDDQNLDCFGYANLHNWSLSTDGGTTSAQYENCSAYRWCADVTLTGTANGEGGLRLSPWWSPDVDGRFMINSGGEIACFGGRLPFYSFTGNHGITYTRGVVAHMEAIYLPHALDAGYPATIEYRISLGGGPTFSSGPLSFDQANPGEDPPHGLWGALYPHTVGGYFLVQTGAGTPVGMTANFANICYEFGTTPTTTSTWGKIKTLYR
jgi:hypothetical protein